MKANTILSTIRGSWALLERAEKRQFAFLSTLGVFAAVFELLALSSALPIIGLAFEPSKVIRNEYVSMVWRLVGEPSVADFILVLAGACVLLIAVAAVINLVTLSVTMRLGGQWQVRVAGDLIRRCLSAPYAWFLDKHSTFFVRLFSTDISFWWRDVMHRLILMISAALTLAFAVFLVVTMAPLAGLLSIGGALLVSLAVFLPMQPMLRRQAQLSRDHTNAMMRTASNGVSGIKDIKVTQTEAHFVGVFMKAFRASTKSRAKVVVSMYIGPTLLLLGSQMALIATSIVLSRAGLSAAELSTLMALLLLVASRVIPAVSRVAAGLNRLSDVAPFIDDVAKLNRDLPRKDPDDGRAQDARPATFDKWRSLSLDDLRFRYDGAQKDTLAGVTFEIERGQSYGIVGSSGAGKSTLVDIVLGLLKPGSGELRVDGKRISEGTLFAWRAQAGYVAQSPFLLDESLRANILFGRKPSVDEDEAIWRAAERAKIADFIRELPDGLDTVVGERGVRISGGQRQRIAIARALLLEPSLLVLDEATNALDPLSEEAIQSTIDGLRGAVTTIIVAHRLSTVQKCDRILLMENGSVTATGTFRELYEGNALFRRLATTGNV